MHGAQMCSPPQSRGVVAVVTQAGGMTRWLLAREAARAHASPGAASWRMT